MRAQPTVRALRNSVLKGAVGRRPAQALVRGVQAAEQVGAAASEFRRVRRDPSELALRRRRAAVRRVRIWATGTLVVATSGAAVTVGVVNDGLAPTVLLSLLLLGGLLIWCVVGLIKSVNRLRLRSRVVTLLPPPQPARQPVAPPIRASILALDACSDELRRLVSMLPSDADADADADVDADAVAVLRRNVLGSADAAERQLRRQAQQFTELRKAAGGAPSDARREMDTTAELLADRITAGVQEYERLVAAAISTVAASAQLSGVLTGLRTPTERLLGLASGMREISEVAGGGRLRESE